MAASAPPAASKPSVRATVEALSREHSAELRRYLRTLGCPTASIDDLVQDTLLIALQKGFEARNRGAASVWLRATARHLFLRHVRSWRVRREVEVADQVWQRECGADGGDGYVEALRECLAGLPARSRSLVEGAYRDGLGRAQLGRMLGMHADGIKTALRRLRAALLQCIQRRRGGS